MGEAGIGFAREVTLGPDEVVVRLGVGAQSPEVLAERAACALIAHNQGAGTISEPFRIAAQNIEERINRRGSATEMPEAPRPDAQKFFAQYAAEIRGPNYGDHARDFVRSMLARAATAGIYTPETP